VAALGGDSVGQFVAKRRDAIRKDLNEMYRQLGQGDVVPDDKLGSVLRDIECRLTHALEARITPRAVYNRIAAPDLTATPPDENWNQPLSLLVHSSCTLRESLTDLYFLRRFSGLSFSDSDFREVCNPFGDVIVRSPDSTRAKEELARIEVISGGTGSAKERAREVWQSITRTQQAAGKQRSSRAGRSLRVPRWHQRKGGHTTRG